MNQHIESSKQETDTRAQRDLTAKVGVKLTRPEKSSTSTWSTMKRFLRVG